MTVIIHAQEGRHRLRLSPDILTENDFIVLAGARDAFDEGALPQRSGQVGGRILRVTHTDDQPRAFAVLAQCATLFRQLLAEHLGGLHYVQPQGESVSGAGTADGSALDWLCDADGVVRWFSLPPVVASSPLLLPLTRDLAARPMTDDRRFAFLAAAFAGA